MQLKNWCTHTTLLAAILVSAAALPTSLIEDIKSNELRDNKAKRAHEPLQAHEENPRQPVAYFSNPTAIKRGTNTKNEDPQNGSDWEAEDNEDSLPQLPSSLYNNDQQFDDKTIAEYEKGFRYGTNKDKIDEALENAVLKSELYGDPAAINQYRYYGSGAEDRRRKRRDAQRLRLDSRLKREVELTPEDMLTILTLWENEHQRPRSSWRDSSLDNDRSMEEFDDEDENWMNTPVYPHASTHPKPMSPNYYYEKEPQIYDKRQWEGFDKKKRFMVARKRSDPTRELRYLTGPGTNDYFALSQLLNSQREPNVPLYRRMML